MDCQAEAVEVREALEWVQAFRLEVSEVIDAYQHKHSPSSGRAGSTPSRSIQTQRVSLSLSVTLGHEPEIEVVA